MSLTLRNIEYKLFKIIIKNVTTNNIEENEIFRMAPRYYMTFA